MALHNTVECTAGFTTCDTFDDFFCNCQIGNPNGCQAIDPVGIQGQWSDTATASSQFGSGAAWSTLSGAQVYNDGQYATVTLAPSFTDGANFYCFNPSRYIVLTGLGLSVPTGATIYGFAFAQVSHANIVTSTALLNFGVTKFGTNYFYADPNTGFCPGEIAAQNPPYFYTQQNWFTGYGTLTDSFQGPLPETLSGCPTKHKLSLLYGMNTTTWSPSDVNDPSFGVVMVFGDDNTANSLTISLDYFTVAVYFTGGGAPGPPTVGGINGVTRQVFNVFDKRRVWGGR